MAIVTIDQLVDALANNAERVVIDKASIANQTAGRLCSMWRATGLPGQGAVPPTAAVPTNATLGAVTFANQTAPVQAYLAWLTVLSGNAAQGVEIYDRVAHFGGLSLVLTTPQATTGLDLSTLGVSAARLGAANYSDVQWFLEVYADGGATASSATINVTYDDASTGNLNVIAVGGTLRAGNMFALRPLIPTAQQGRHIRGINNVTLSASTTVAGNFGFTAMRQQAVSDMLIANAPTVKDAMQLGLPSIPNDACIQFVVVPSTTSSGLLRGQAKIAYG